MPWTIDETTIDTQIKEQPSDATICFVNDDPTGELTQLEFNSFKKHGRIQHQLVLHLAHTGAQFFAKYHLTPEYPDTFKYDHERRVIEIINEEAPQMLHTLQQFLASDILPKEVIQVMQRHIYNQNKYPPSEKYDSKFDHFATAMGFLEEDPLTEESIQMAVSSLKTAASKRHPDAAHLLAILATEPKEKLRWTHRAAELGDWDSFERLQNLNASQEISIPENALNNFLHAYKKETIRQEQQTFFNKSLQTIVSKLDNFEKRVLEDSTDKKLIEARDAIKRIVVKLTDASDCFKNGGSFATLHQAILDATAPESKDVQTLNQHRSNKAIQFLHSLIIGIRNFFTGQWKKLGEPIQTDSATRIAKFRSDFFKTTPSQEDVSTNDHEQKKRTK